MHGEPQWSLSLTLVTGENAFSRTRRRCYQQMICKIWVRFLCVPNVEAVVADTLYATAAGIHYDCSSTQGDNSACAGVRRALAESVVGLRVPGAVVREMVKSLGTIPKPQRQDYLITSETYGCCRMLLAPLEKSLFDQVVCSRGCNFWEELQPLRDIRPVNGGKGFDLGLLVQLRELNFDLT